MQNKYRHYDTGTFIINIDTCEDEVLTGQFYFPYHGEINRFKSLMQLLQRIEYIMDEMGELQSFNMMRTFFPPQISDLPTADLYFPPAGKVATFSLQIMFRRNASWQGALTWVEAGESRHFRSVLELITLMSSAIGTKQPARGYIYNRQPIWVEG